MGVLRGTRQRQALALPQPPDTGPSSDAAAGPSPGTTTPALGAGSLRDTVWTAPRAVRWLTRGTSATVKSPSPSSSVVRLPVLVASSTECAKNNRHGEATSLTDLASPPSSAKSRFVMLTQNGRHEAGEQRTSAGTAGCSRPECGPGSVGRETTPGRSRHGVGRLVGPSLAPPPQGVAARVGASGGLTASPPATDEDPANA